MLARTNRLLTADDFRSTLRRGRRTVGKVTTVHVNATRENRPPRFGFITSAKVGSAVQRNRIRRRLRAICRELLDAVPAGTDVVVRATPGAASANWTTLQEDIHRALTRSSAT